MRRVGPVARPRVLVVTATAVARLRSMAALHLTNALLPDGSAVDVTCVDGVVTAVGPGTTAPEGADIVDLGGRLLLPAAAEPHAHLDKAFLAERIENPTGDLMGAILAMQASRHLLSVPDIAERAERAALTMLSNGSPPSGHMPT